MYFEAAMILSPESSAPVLYISPSLFRFTSVFYRICTSTQVLASFYPYTTLDNGVQSRFIRLPEARFDA